MSQVAKDVVSRVPVGGSGRMSRPEGRMLEDFQLDVEYLEKMEGDGLIEITDRHEEDQSGGRFIDNVGFRRLQ